jgi:hypothetical protein
MMKELLKSTELYTRSVANSKMKATRMSASTDMKRTEQRLMNNQRRITI